MDSLPIDIHSNKLLDWLVSRRHCGKTWQEAVVAIREKIASAIQDMPENDKVVRLLQASCKQEIVDVLRITEKDSKNIFGFYSSQRMKDWQEIISLYEKESAYLAEAAQFLQRLIAYEIPSLRRQIVRLQHDIEDASKKEADYSKQAADSLKQYEKELARWKIEGRDLKKELLVLVSSELPAFVGTTFASLKRLAESMDYYAQFTSHICGDAGSKNAHFPLLRLILGSKDVPLVYEWHHGIAPERVEKPEFTEGNKDNAVFAGDEIDFGDDEEIDFGITVEEQGAGDRSDIPVEPTETRVARGEEAYSVFESPSALIALQAELNELRAFLKFRKTDEFDEHPSDVYLFGVYELPRELKVGSSTLSAWLQSTESLLSSLKDPKVKHLTKVWTSPIYVEELVNKISEKQRLHSKHLKFASTMREKHTKLASELLRTQQLLPSLVEAAKYLQEKIEQDISKRYNNREVYIMGEINAVLYNQ